MPKCICAHGFKMGTSTSLLDAGHIGARLWLRFLQRADDGAWQYSLCLFACFSCLLPAASLLCSGVCFGLLTGAVEHRGPRARRCVQACFGPWHTGHCLPLLIFGLDSTQNSGCAAGFCGLGLRSPSLLEPRDEHDLPNLFLDRKGPSRH